MPLDLFAPQPVPAPPAPQHSFSSFQVNNPSAPPPGDWLDSELGQTYRTLQRLIEWAGVSLAGDGSLRRDAVTRALGPRAIDNSGSDTTFASNVAKDYAVLSQAWAEYMPGTIPPNILASNDITGDHWSSRWWANQAATYVGHALLDDLAGDGPVDSGGGSAPLDGWTYGLMNGIWTRVLPLTGGTLTGPLFLPSTPPTGPYQAVTKSYVDTFMAGSGFLPLTGGTLTGALTTPFLTVGSTTATDATISIDGAAGTVRKIQFLSGPTGRWVVGVNTSPETGLNHGSEFEITRIGDNGGNIGAAIAIDRQYNMTLNSRTVIFDPLTSYGAQLTLNAGATIGGAALHFIGNSGGGKTIRVQDNIFYIQDAGGSNVILRVDDTGNLRAQGGVHAYGDDFFGLSQSGVVRRLDWAGDGVGGARYYQAFDTQTGKFTWHGLTGDVMTLDPGTGQFIVKGNVSVPYPGSLTAGKSVLADHVLGFRTGTGFGGSVGSWDTTGGQARGFRLNATTSTIEWGPLNPDTGDMSSVLMRLDASGNLSVSGSVSGSTAGVGEAPQNGTTYGRVNATWTPVLPLTGGTITGNVITSGNVQSQAAVTAKTAVLGDHVYGFRTGTGFGGSVGSWDTTTNKGSGFRLNAAAVAMEFGTFDANTGDLSAISATLDAAGNLALTGTDGAGVNLYLRGTGTNPNKALRVLNGRLEWLNSAYSAIIASLDDTGFMTVAAGLTATTGNIRALGGDISASAGHNITAGNAVLGDHVFGFRAGAAGGVVGSWETGTGKAFGFRVASADGSAYFGPVNAATGDATSNSAIMYVSGDFQIMGSNALKAAGTVWANPSDARTKTVTGDYTHGLAEILELRPIRYTLRDDWSVGPPQAAQHPSAAPSPLDLISAAGTEFIGLIAQEAEPWMPEMVGRISGVVQGQEVDDLRTLDLSALPLALVNAVRELDARLRVLEGPRV